MVPDRGKIIGLLQETAEYFRECRNNASFASKAENHFWELQNAANEAIELLKEQEAKPPKVHENAYGRKFYYCPKCNRAFDCFNQESYCHDCGQAVKWV